MNSILSKEPNRDDVKNNLGYLFLTLGKFKEGWEKYEYRWKVDPGDRLVATREVFMGWRDQEESSFVERTRDRR